MEVLRQFRGRSNVGTTVVWAVSPSSRDDHTASSDALRQLVVVAPFQHLFIFSVVYFL